MRGCNRHLRMIERMGGGTESAGKERNVVFARAKCEGPAAVLRTDRAVRLSALFRRDLRRAP